MLAFLGIPSPAALAEDLVKDAVSLVSSLVASAAVRLVEALVDGINATTDPVFSSGWFAGPGGTALLGIVGAIAGSILVLALMLAALESIWTGSSTPVIKAVSALPGAVLKTALLVPLTSLLVRASDQAAAALLRLVLKQLGVACAALGVDLAVGGIVGMFVAPVVVLAALALWVELALRAALVYLVVMTARAIIAAAVHPRLRQSLGRLAELGVALIASKVMIALALAVGLSEMSTSGAASFGQAIGSLVAAVATLCIACFAPYVLFRLISVEVAHLEGLSRRPARATRDAAQYTATARQSLSRYLNRLGNPEASATSGTAGPGPLGPGGPGGAGGAGPVGDGPAGGGPAGGGPAGGPHPRGGPGTGGAPDGAPGAAAGPGHVTSAAGGLRVPAAVASTPAAATLSAVLLSAVPGASGRVASSGPRSRVPSDRPAAPSPDGESESSAAALTLAGGKGVPDA